MENIGVIEGTAGFADRMERATGREARRFASLRQARQAARLCPAPLIVLAEDASLSQDDRPLDDHALRVIAIAERFDHEGLRALLRRGVRGYQTACVPAGVLRSAVQMVRLGEYALPSRLVAHLADRPAARRPVPLSAREQVVIRCLAEGLANKEISRSVGIAEATAKVHVKAIMRKLGVSNRTQAAVWAVRNGLAGPDARV